VNPMTRRDWLKVGITSLGAAALAPAVPAFACPPAGETYSFHHDYVLGTSLDLCVAAPDAAVAAAAERTVLDEIERLRLVLSGYDPASELSRVNQSCGPVPVSPDLTEVLLAYEHWQRKTGGTLCLLFGATASAAVYILFVP